MALLLLLVGGAPCLAGLIGTSTEVRMGRDAAAQLESKYGTVEDAAKLARIRALGERLVAICGRTDLKEWHFNILNMKEINALAVPGGWVYVTKGLMEVPLSEDELGFVLAHEVTHIAQRHGAKQMEKSLGLSLVVGLVTRSSDARLAARVVSMLLESGYSRKDEYRADAGGCSSLMQLRFHPWACVAFLERLKKMEKDKPSELQRWFATHPPTSDRIARLESQIAKAGYPRPAGHDPSAKQ